MPTVEFHALHISAHPHPPGIYRKIFEKFANKRVKYYGDKVAAFSKPSDTKNGIFYGVIFTWTEIDQRQPMVDTVLLDKPDPEKLLQVKIPNDIGFNAQVFYYAFREHDHVLVFESRNAENARLGPSSAERLFRGIFNQRSLSRMLFDGVRLSHIEVDLFIKNNAVEEIFSIKNLTSVIIEIAVPNDDDETKGADEIIERIKKIRARRQTTTYKSVSVRDGLKPDQEMMIEGKAALRHGYVQGDGNDGTRKISLNSKDYPQVESALLDPMYSVVDTILQIARQSFKREAQPEAD